MLLVNAHFSEISSVRVGRERWESLNLCLPCLLPCRTHFLVVVAREFGWSGRDFSNAGKSKLRIRFLLLVLLSHVFLQCETPSPTLPASE